MKKATAQAFLLMILLTSSCICKSVTPPTDNAFGLPNATQTGANIFACTLNGGKFIGHDDMYSGMGATITKDTLVVDGRTKTAHLQWLAFFLKGNLVEGSTYSMGSSDLTFTYFTDSACASVFSFVELKASSGTVKITKLDKTEKIVSGLFNCVVPTPNNCDTLRFYEGRFDFRYDN
jgi:hypothetical protein